MLPRETWRVAVDALWSNKLRAILTTLGVVIGSACIVLVVTVAVTGRRYVIGQIEGVGANLVYANYEVNPQQAVVRSDEITLADMEALKNALPNVVAVAATSQGLLRNVVTGGTEHGVTLFGATDGFQKTINDAMDKVPGTKTFGATAMMGVIALGVDRFIKPNKWLKLLGTAGIVLAAAQVGTKGSDFKFLGDESSGDYDLSGDDDVGDDDDDDEEGDYDE